MGTSPAKCMCAGRRVATILEFALIHHDDFVGLACGFFSVGWGAFISYSRFF
jgi:hypothetical protein